MSLADLQALVYPGDLAGALHTICARYGVSHMTFLVVRIANGPLASPYYCSTYPTDWIRTYLANDYFTIDPVIDVARWGLLPVDWSTLDQRSVQAERLFDEAAANGIGPNGLTIPVRGANGERCLFSVTSDLPEKDWSALRGSALHDLHILSYYLHEQVLEISGLRQPALLRSLSGRERQCLQLLGSGKIYKQIAATLGISESAVRLYVRKARRKLSATTSYHAVAKASYLELIDV
ncbi:MULTISPECIES: LuxR family transcriptional regulator [unclassified Rhizobium]|uniref:LuxR family transcriptional regulator n=1 Tax=unclassified Rhizobium TaxID=2613769 RepID=UPI000B1A655B|nr:MULTISPECIES: LuxR family transcriptional regulator [unclassified Rhizobium]